MAEADDPDISLKTFVRMILHDYGIKVHLLMALYNRHKHDEYIHVKQAIKIYNEIKECYCENQVVDGFDTVIEALIIDGYVDVYQDRVTLSIPNDDIDDVISKYVPTRRPPLKGTFIPMHVDISEIEPIMSKYETYILSAIRKMERTYPFPVRSNTIDVMDMYVSTFREDKAAPPVYDVMKTLYYYRYIDREGLLDPPDKYSLVWTTKEGRTYLLNEVMLKDINENIEREQS